MDTASLAIDVPEPRTASFSRRQIHGERTGRQLAFDIAFGLVLPPICLLLDPFVFTADSEFYAIRSPLILFIAIQLALLATWLTFGAALGRFSAVAAGAMIPGALLALAIGVSLAPVVAIGTLVFGLGLLGFTPLGTAAALYRNARRALRVAPFDKFRSVCIALGVCVAIAIPLVASSAQTQLREHYLADLRGADRAAAHTAQRRLARWGWLLAPERLVGEYRGARHDEVRERLDNDYQQMTGRDLDSLLD